MIPTRHCFFRFLLSLLFVFLSATDVSASESLHVQIDRLIAAQADGPSCAVADDAEFLRRVYLDLAGRIPSVGEARAFLLDADPAKRERLIDKLLASDEYPRRMTELFNVMLMERMGDHDDWTRFLNESFRKNKPWDQLVREILYPNPDNESIRGAALFLSKRLEHYGENPVDYPGLVRDVGRLFLGIDVQCAQCHDHLFVNEYKQEDFQGLFAFLSQATIRGDVNFPAVAENLVTQKIAFKSVFVQQEKTTGPRLPKSPEVEIVVFPQGEEYAVAPDKKTRFPGVPKFSPLKILSEQLPRAENEMFARNISNRVWWMLMGRGLVYPLDMHHNANPATHPELLDVLSRELIAHRFDLKWLMRELALSETYQRSSLVPDGAGEIAPQTYRVFVEKRLSAEQWVSSVLQCTGRDEPLFGTADMGTADMGTADMGTADMGTADMGTAAKAENKPASESTAGSPVSKEIRERFAKAFANPPREPEIEHSPSLKAALFIMNDKEILDRFEVHAEHLVDRLVRQTDDRLMTDELFLAALSRLPTDDERADVASYLGSHTDHRDTAIGRLAWSLVASTEFAVNH